MFYVKVVPRDRGVDTYCLASRGDGMDDGPFAKARLSIHILMISSFSWSSTCPKNS